MKNIILPLAACFLCLAASAQMPDALDEQKKKIFPVVKKALKNYVSVMEKLPKGDRQKKEDAYKALFLEPLAESLEDIYLDPKVPGTRRIAPSLLFKGKFSKLEKYDPFFEEYTFDFDKQYKLFSNYPLPFDCQLLEQEALSTDFFDESLCKHTGRQGWFYMKTGIEKQLFSGSKSSDKTKVERSDKLMVHWIFKFSADKKIKPEDFKILSIHNYENYSYHMDLGKVKDEPEVVLPPEKKAEEKVGEFLTAYFDSLKTLRNQPGKAQKMAQTFFIAPAKVALDFTGDGKKHKLAAADYLSKVADAKNLTQLFKVESFGDVWQEDAWFHLVARTSATATYERADTLWKDGSPVNFQVSFRFDPKAGKFADFKIAGTVFNAKGNIPHLATPITMDSGTTPEEGIDLPIFKFCSEEEAKTTFNKQAESLVREFLVFSSRRCRNASNNEQDFFKLFQNPGIQTIEVSNWWTKKTETFPTAEYPHHLDTLSYASKYLTPGDVNVSPDALIQIPSGEWAGSVQFEQRFVGLDEKNNRKYADRTVKKAEIILLKAETGGCRAFLGKVIVLSTVELPAVP